ncbi:MAG TPA: hypothetical protein VLD57_07505 [Blastocatellia bacterium]|nr:hypothetical protein [Blastocatellia bacterium]
MKANLICFMASRFCDHGCCYECLGERLGVDPQSDEGAAAIQAYLDREQDRSLKQMLSTEKK